MGQAAYDMTEVRRRRAPQAQPKVPLRVEKGGKKRLNPARATSRKIMEIDLALNNEVEDFKEDYESIYLEIIQEACKQLDIHDDLELSVIFVDDQRIHEINKEYRKIDRSTDVISFALEDSEQYYIEGMPREIGDIFISIDHAKMQA